MFEESAQEPTVRFNIQPDTQLTGSNDLRVSEANYSNQSIAPPSDFPTVFSHEPTPTTSATQTTSTGSSVKAAKSESTAFNFKTRNKWRWIYRPVSRQILIGCPCKAELEKKSALPSTDRGNRVACAKSLCEISSRQRKENSKRGPFLWDKQLN